MKEAFIPLLDRIGVGTNNIGVIHWIAIVSCIILLFYISSLICQKIVIPISSRTHEGHKPNGMISYSMPQR